VFQVSRKINNYIFCSINFLFSYHFNLVYVFSYPYKYKEIYFYVFGKYGLENMVPFCFESLENCCFFEYKEIYFYLLKIYDDLYFESYKIGCFSLFLFYVT